MSVTTSLSITLVMLCSNMLSNKVSKDYNFRTNYEQRLYGNSVFLKIKLGSDGDSDITV